MRTDWIAQLRCPECRSTVDFVDLSARIGSEITEGLLGCAATSCGMRFPIINGVPRLLAASRRARLLTAYPELFAKHPTYRDALALSASSTTEFSSARAPLPLRRSGHPLAASDTSASFTSLHDELPAGTYSGKHLLDAGCGDGRYARFYADRGAHVVALALSEAAADAVFSTVRGHERIAVVQGDLPYPPFAEASFDVVHSAAELPFALRPLAGAASVFALLAPGGRWQSFWHKSRQDENAGAHALSGGIAAVRTAGQAEPLHPLVSTS